MSTNVTKIAGQVGYVAAPISINQDGSLSLTFSLGLLDQNGAMATHLGNQSHYLPASDAALILDEPIHELGISPRDAIVNRCIAALKAKGQWSLSTEKQPALGESMP